jgi:dTDP-4-amino-4,6-dideoxygalactose transaminase
MFDLFAKQNISLPVTDWLTERVISLPMHTELENEQQEFICSKILEYIKQ